MQKTTLIPAGIPGQTYGNFSGKAQAVIVPIAPVCITLTNAAINQITLINAVTNQVVMTFGEVNPVTLTDEEC